MGNPTLWLTIGFLGQAIFTARFLVQWIVSEKKRDSVVPVAFWWLSLLGGLTLLSYATYRRDPVIILGQA
ncbi:MAG: lipid-A-disaccharide synthase N-terminal domain-containing protein, partial [Planctomycetaceae bacterium]